jgi:hypothetical protein
MASPVRTGPVQNNPSPQSLSVVILSGSHISPLISSRITIGQQGDLSTFPPSFPPNPTKSGNKTMSKLRVFFVTEVVV